MTNIKDTIEVAVVMTKPYIEEFANQRKRRFDWAAFLPQQKAWIQTLILLPFGLPVANFLGASWHFSVNSIVEERQYLVGVFSMAINLLLPSLFFAFLFHWGWFIWKQESATWYPKAQAFWAGAYATLTIAASFGIVGLFTHTLGICGNLGWGAVSETLLCNLDGYGFESKSWFGAWFIIAAYCYRVRGSIDALARRIFQKQHYSPRADLHDFTSVATAHGDLPPHDDFSANSIDTIATNSED
ncbi:hypothetical protein [Chamaesiphon sp. VAR_48_metabat_135_sub]|uniref:hypothetical protein n=1 Tax=Chamaesiphon sp. VAR_48_metabat_135_sub TaxID=2964699 RepID=UPI00286CF692|nr:hypothetical protein [Chamaesiphon sp. VAR_48_metabat_135_sub]